MRADVRMTMEKAEQTMLQLGEIFEVVRLVDADMPQQIAVGTETGLKLEPCECYAFWKRKKRCDNCISLKVLHEKGQKTKLEFLDGKMYQVIARYVEIDGKPCVMEMVSCLDNDSLLDENGREELMKKLAGYDEELYRDVLTGAYNRRYFEDRVRYTTKPAGVAMLDLDDFKMYNDTYGHDAGDRVLETVSRVMRSCIRETDTLIRYGGDEFLLLLSDIKEPIFTRKLKEIQENVHDAVVPGYMQLHLSISVGGVLSRGESIAEAVKRADKLMYEAKQGKNRVVTEETLSGELPQQPNTPLSSAKKTSQKYRILIVDDSEMNRFLLSEMLGDKFEIMEAVDGLQCMELLEKYEKKIALVLLDIVMPVMDGFEVLTQMNKKHWIDDVPVIMISSEDSAASIRRVYELGAADYISCPFDAQVVYRRVTNIIRSYAKQRRLMSMVTDQIYEKEKNNRIMISILSQIVEFRNGESGLHVLHINVLTGMLLERLLQKTDRYRLSWADTLMIANASALHDIGKIGIADAILNKPGKLTKEEFEIIKTHTVIGASILENLELYKDEPLVKVAHQICRWHHERYDGKGYPDGLVGDDIPISAQVVALADVYDALVSERVYKKAYSHEEAIRMILNGECGAFNPLLLECFTDIQDRIREEMAFESGKETNPDNQSKAADELREYEKKKEHLLDTIAKYIQDEYTEDSLMREWSAKNRGGGY